jgi:hypothetical protein
MLVTAGIVSLLVLREHKPLLASIMLLQAGIVILLAAYSPVELRARRFLVLEWTSMVGIVMMARDARPLGYAIVLLLLTAGNVWQWMDLAQTVRGSFPAGQGGFTLPFVRSSDGVGHVDYDSVRWARELRSRVEGGERLLLLYNLGCYPENITNPAGVLERLYLGLGHERFVQSIYVFGSDPCRYSCLPIRPVGDFLPFLDKLRPGSAAVYYDMACVRPEAPGKEVLEQLAALGQRFRLVAEREGGRFQRFKLAGAATGSN